MAAAASSATPKWSTMNSGMNDIVEGPDNLFYISITDNNQGNSPDTSAANWSQIKFNTVWNANETYALNDIVQGSDGLLYVSTVDGANQGNDPVSGAIQWKAATSLDIDPIISAAALTFAYNNF